MKIKRFKLYENSESIQEKKYLFQGDLIEFYNKWLDAEQLEPMSADELSDLTVEQDEFRNAFIDLWVYIIDKTDSF